MADDQAHPRHGVTREELRAQVLEQARDAVEAGKTAMIVPPEWLVELLTVATPANTLSQLGPEPIQGYTIKQVASAFGKTYGSVWNWIQSGLLPGAYRFMDREWRVPLSAVDTMLQAQRIIAVDRPTPEGRAALGAWRERFNRKPLRRRRSRSEEGA